MAIKYVSPNQYPLLNDNREAIVSALNALQEKYGRGYIDLIDFAWCTFRYRPVGEASRGLEKNFTLTWNPIMQSCTVRAWGHQVTFQYVGEPHYAITYDNNLDLYRAYAVDTAGVAKRIFIAQHFTELWQAYDALRAAYGTDIHIFRATSEGATLRRTQRLN